MQLVHLVDRVTRVQSATKKNEKIALLADFLKQTRGRETELAALYLCGRLTQGKIGVGWSTIESATVGAPQAESSLTLAEVDQVMSQIASDQGPGSSDRRIARLRSLFQRARIDERRFLSHLLMGELRQGALEGLLLEAIAKASGLPSSEVRRAMMFTGNIGTIARAALEEGSPALSRTGFRIFTPVAPMLADTAEDVGEALERLGDAAFEFKLDGARIQVHKEGDEVRIFTRRLQDVTERLPELVEWARTLLVREIVLDGEAIALRPDGRPHPFQVTMRRFGRIKNIEAMRREIPLAAFYFDCLYREGDGALFTLPYRRRFKILTETIPSERVIQSLMTKDRAEAERFLRRALEVGHEGTMAKALDAPYTAGQRGLNWLKLKPAKTLDLVILAAEWGSGRRKGWLSNLHLGARDPESGQFVMLGKTFKGLTDEMLKWQTEKLLSLEASRDDWAVYVRPELVVEVAFNEIQESSRYPAGLALRFARVKRFRPDKSGAEADTIQTVAEIFRRKRE
ncbi:MAG TPA: ATP-dependent DNA ligase [Nitrospiria bacterium]|jgi:DNA ligase-1|nr:ATP-dependent DNA ligase [Nitrospiria bacterium]